MSPGSNITEERGVSVCLHITPACPDGRSNVALSLAQSHAWAGLNRPHEAVISWTRRQRVLLLQRTDDGMTPGKRLAWSVGSFGSLRSMLTCRAPRSNGKCHDQLQTNPYPNSGDETVQSDISSIDPETTVKCEEAAHERGRLGTMPVPVSRFMHGTRFGHRTH